MQYLDGNMLICSVRDDTIKLLDLRKNQIVYTYWYVIHLSSIKEGLLPVIEFEFLLLVDLQ